MKRLIKIWKSEIQIWIDNCSLQTEKYLAFRRMCKTVPALQHIPSYVRITTLHWRHNEPDGVWNHQPRDCLLNCLFRCRSKKTSKLRVTGLCAENSRRHHEIFLTRGRQCRYRFKFRYIHITEHRYNPVDIDAYIYIYEYIHIGTWPPLCLQMAISRRTTLTEKLDMFYPKFQWLSLNVDHLCGPDYVI